MIAFVQEMRASDVERLKARNSLGSGPTSITISTIHKVKGLEYDTVVVMPASARFPLSNGSGRRVSKADAAEEARLYYVAMTRARDRVYVGWGKREKKWWKAEPYEGDGAGTTVRLEGSPKEVFISWPCYATQVDSGVQEYMKRSVSAMASGSKGAEPVPRARCKLTEDGSSQNIRKAPTDSTPRGERDALFCGE